MNNKLKPILLLSLTLLLGAAIGFFGAGFWLRGRAAQRQARPADGLQGHIEQIVQARPEQREAIRRQVEPFSIGMDSLRATHQRQVKERFETLYDSLEPVLEPPQRELLRARLDRLHQGPGPRGPHGPGRGQGRGQGHGQGRHR